MIILCYTNLNNVRKELGKLSAVVTQNIDGLPTCSCGGMIKPDVVLYEESLNQKTIEGAVSAISACDMLIIGGTSLAVYPAAAFVRYYRGNKLAVINKSQLDVDADLVISQSIGEVFAQLNLEL